MTTCSVQSIINDNLAQQVNERGKPIVDGNIILDKKAFGLFNDDISRRLKAEYKVDSDENVFIIKNVSSLSFRPDVYGYTKTYDYTRWVLNFPLVDKLEANRVNPPAPSLEELGIKPGVPELFESNPQLADEVYRALGFKQTVVTEIGTVFKDPSKFSQKDYDALEDMGYTEDQILDKLSARKSETVLAETAVTPQQKQQAQQAYSQYLDTIFPDSKVKDIVRHDTDNKFWEGELPNGKDFKSKRGIYFNATSGNEGGFVAASYKIKAIINLTNPAIKDMDKDYAGQNTNKLYPNNDGVIGYIESPSEVGEYIVSTPEQIHILGNQEDIEGFKKFVRAEEAQEEYLTEEEREAMPTDYYMGDEALRFQEREDRQEFRNENSNMPDEDIDDYYNSCR